MQTNAAKELLETIERWEGGPGQTLTSQRTGMANGGIRRQLWAETNRSVALLMEVEAFAREIGEDVEGDPFFMAMWKYLYSPESTWTSTGSKQQLDAMVKRNLRTLSRLMEGHESAPSLDDAEVVALRSAVQQSLDLLEAATGGSEEHREHVAYLLKRCLDILKGETIDLVALQSLSFQVVGEAMSDGALWNWDEAGTFFQNIAVIARVWGPKVATQAAVQVSSDLVIEGTKVATQIGATVVKGLIESGPDT